MSQFSLGGLSIKVVVGALAAGSLGWAAGAANVSGADSRPKLLQSEACDQAAQQHATPSPVGNVQTISVSIPPTVFLRVDSAGRITEVATNTGCAPRSSDDLYIFAPDGSITLTTAIDVDSIEWVGDFSSAGEFQAQL